ncbi:transposable element Tc3 transposase [Trichonephila clavipes]|nr:transposable element Tc3 transposase [Trichonephila clavipes]
MTGQRSVRDEVLLPHAQLFRGAVGDKFVFMDDNATCYRNTRCSGLSDSGGIQRLVWPARSPDLYPIENVECFGRQVAGQKLSPTYKELPHPVHSQRNGINCLNSCWILFCAKYGTTCGMLHHTLHGGHISAQLDTFL